MIELLPLLLSWRSVIDIVLITIGLFLIYNTLKKLGTWKILSGVALVAAIYLLATLLELDGIVWFYQNVSQVALIGFIVVFQPEIRKLFEATVLPRRSMIKNQASNLAGEISEVVHSMAKQKTGALIVIPGKEPIDRHLAGGQSLNADFSAHLVLSIFDPHSPGHDGAIIIENGKISRFGMRLPISSSCILGKECGTRHYAAAGLSDVTDALVIVVSEERGTITAFKNSEGVVQSSNSQLNMTINNHWKSASSFLPQSTTGRRVFPWAEAAVSFMLALGFWYLIVVGETEIQEKVVTIPVEYSGTPKELILTGDKLSEVKVHLVGPKSGMANLNDYRVRVDLSAAQSGRQKFTITEDHINLAKKVKLLDVTPSVVPLELVRMVEKEVVIQAQLVGKLPPSLKLVSIEVMPQKLKALVKESDSKSQNLVLATTPIYLENIKSDTVIQTKIIVSPRFQHVDKKWPDVDVHIKVVKVNKSLQ